MWAWLGSAREAVNLLADEFLPELPNMRLEQDPIHRHKDVLTHTIAVVENVRPLAEIRAERPDHPDFDFREKRLHQGNLKAFMDDHPDEAPPINIDRKYVITTRRTKK